MYNQFTILMAYKALYNKYRPSTFEEVAGQRSIVRTLKNAISSGKIAHAYLFCGPRGTGKTSMARLFAKALNCEEGPGHQCNKCANCLSLNSGSHPDVLEIDAASNNGVEQVRDLIEKVRYAPMRGRYKIYIIDEVHMMSAGAFNALLKTLEEPPDHVIFILATTEPHKILPTILSRCQRYDFAKIDNSDIKEKLIWIMGQEGVSYEEEGLDEIVSLADGGMRDALSILDQVLAYGGNQLKEEDVLAVFGLTSTAEKLNLIELISKSDVASVLSKLEQFLTGGIDIKRLNGDLLNILKDLLIYKRTKQASLLSVLKEEDAIRLSPIVKARIANQMIDILLKAQIDFKSVSNIRSLFELTLLQLCNLFSEADYQEPEPVRVVPKAESIPAPQPITPAPKPAPEPKPVFEAEPLPKVESKPEPVIQPKQEPIIEKEATPVIENKQEPSYIPERDGVYSGTSVPDFLFEDDKKAEEPTVKPSIAVEPQQAPAPKPEPAPVPRPVAPAPKPTPEPVVEPLVSIPSEPEKPAIRELDVQDIEDGSLVDTGTPVVLSDETILDIMVLGPRYKLERKELSENWERFTPYKLDPKLSQVATLISSGRPFCLCEDVLLINYNFPAQKEQTNLWENQKAIQDMLATLLGRRVLVYGLDRFDSSRVQQKYSNLRQLSQLPSPESITLNLPKGGK